APGHEEIEIALVKLYGQTGNQLYLDMAKRFLEIRGVTYRPHGRGINAPSYAQQQAPAAEQREAVGHAVRAMYLYAAMAEVDSIQGADDYSAALDSIWHDIVDRKMHISGGLGAVPGIEGFGPAYVLPNKETYLETCAAVGNVLFNVRMFLKHERGEFVDVAEAALYNNCLAGVGLDAQSFFYPNPLEADNWHAPRSAWFGTACCPSNIARLIPQISGYMYAVRGERLYCVLYGDNAAETEVAGTQMKLTQRTEYPLDGEIELELEPTEPVEFELALRIPSWAGKQFVPGQLYHFVDAAPPWSVEVNGEKVAVTAHDGFAVIRRRWSPGDKVALHLPMPVRVNACIDQVEADRDRVALSRGPLLFCAEGIDNGGSVQRLFFPGVPDGAAARVERIADGPLSGLPQIIMPGEQLTEAGVEPADIALIPYFAWSNRDRGSMITWIGTQRDLAKIDYAAPENLKFADATASHTYEGDLIEAVRMRHTPRSSRDTSIRRWTSWNEKGREQWVEIDLGGAKSIRSVGVYFYDDNGGVQLPGAWHVEVPSADGWRRVEIYNTDAYSTLSDVYNTVHPADPLTADRLRIVMQPRHDDTCVG
ncbi:MAG: glycoside hydrolase family 127 protein, partial [Planctomycetales bacterium]|nr:glycoside hydrolase family 127 protein [Planctomycetales bacterium]